MPFVLWAALAMSLALGGCSSREAQLSFSEEYALYFPKEARREPGDLWQKRAWLHRVSRILRGGRGLDPTHPTLNPDALISKSKEEIIDLLMADPLFGDAVLDFNLSFLGAKVDELTNDNHSDYSSTVLDFPQAIASAQETLKDGDYFKLLDLRHPIFMRALGEPYGGDASEQALPAPERRKRIFERHLKAIDAVIAWVIENPQAPIGELCNRLNNNFDVLPYSLLGLGLDFALVEKLFFQASWYGRFRLACFTGDTSVNALAELTNIREKNVAFVQAVLDFNDTPSKAEHIGQVRVLTFTQAGLPNAVTQFGEKHIRLLTNSSTNYNRKRAAYVLKRFFCDDLTPIAVESPSQHAQDQHGSDASCVSCHYKLDPMAGFFKDYGFVFNDFSALKTILFDDGASKPRDAYQTAWKAPAGAGRAWNIGYIRSATRTELNEYGETPEDLFAIIRKAPEVRACVARRMFEHFAGAGRMLDAGYLEHLAKGLEGPDATSAIRFKATVKKILLSASFAETNPEPGKCYDFAPGSKPEDSPPCEVAHILQKNCVTCHDSVAPGEGGLDLTRWATLADGKRGFVHQDDNGVQLPRRRTFDSIVERLATPDPKLRMPKSSHMSSSDRERLYLWATQQN
jgi:hypothetical protein